MSTAEMTKKEENLAQLHAAAEAEWATFSYAKPDGVSAGKGFVALGRKDIVRGVVQVVKKNGGENNLHYHTGIASFWMVLKGRVRFYGPGDVVIGEFGPMEGTITPRFSRYWFENVGEEDLEILQVAAFGTEKLEKSGRTDVSEQRFKPGTAQRFDAGTAPAKG
jgi:mannose-6-phosphate isomerase-like protein (cupin superfamily)